MDEVEQLRDVLRPFVKHWAKWMDEKVDGEFFHADNSHMSSFANVTYGELRRAREVMERTAAPDAAASEAGEVERLRALVTAARDLLKTAQMAGDGRRVTLHPTRVRLVCDRLSAALTTQGGAEA